MDKYQDAVNKGYVSGAASVPGETDLVNKYGVVACPVDIEIRKNDQLVCRIENNKIDETVTSINAWGDRGTVLLSTFPDCNYEPDGLLTIRLIYFFENVTKEPSPCHLLHLRK